MGRLLRDQISEQEYKSLAHMDVMDYLTRDNPPMEQFYLKDENGCLVEASVFNRQQNKKIIERMDAIEYLQRKSRCLESLGLI